MQFSCVFQSFILKVRVFVSLSHEDSSIVHSPSAYWTTEINTSGFQLCQRATGSTNGTGTINWVAFQDKPGISHGSVTFKGMWTTETKCDKITFSQVRQMNDLLSAPVNLVISYLDGAFFVFWYGRGGGGFCHQPSPPTT